MLVLISRIKFSCTGFSHTFPIYQQIFHCQVPLIKHRAAVRCLDLSSSKQRLAVVDENSKVFVYDLITKEVVFEEVCLETPCYYYLRHSEWRGFSEMVVL